MKRTPTDFRCPSCGATVSPNARSCPCGARRDEDGWIAPETYDGLDLGEDDFDYDDFVRREFGGPSGRGGWLARMTPKERFWWIVAVVVLVAFAALALAGW